MVLTEMKKALTMLAKKPILLWGISLMYVLLGAVATASFALIPIVGLALTQTLSAGMSMIFLDHVQGKEISCDQLFSGFKSNFWHVAGGMCWMSLWIFIWLLIPIAGPVFAVIKAYSYRFTPYILVTRPEISATQALKESMRLTKGFKGKMFGADILSIGLYFAAWLILSLFSRIPYIGILFGIVLAALMIAVAALQTLYFGLMKANFYMDIVVEPKTFGNGPETQEYAYFCPYCGAPVQAGAAFCGSCGKPLAPVPAEGPQAPAEEVTAEAVPEKEARTEETSGEAAVFDEAPVEETTAEEAADGNAVSENAEQPACDEEAADGQNEG